jgi:hypothetical protein
MTTNTPKWLWILAVDIFERLPEAEAARFKDQFSDAIHGHSDLEDVRVPFLLDLLERCLARLAGSMSACADQCWIAAQEVKNTLLSGNVIRLGKAQGLARELWTKAALEATVQRNKAKRDPRVWREATLVREVARTAEAAATTWGEDAVRNAAAAADLAAMWACSMRYAATEEQKGKMVSEARMAAEVEARTQYECLLQLIRETGAQS